MEFSYFLVLGMAVYALISNVSKASNETNSVNLLTVLLSTFYVTVLAELGKMVGFLKF